jgi:hypothetical protein
MPFWIEVVSRPPAAVMRRRGYCRIVKLPFDDEKDAVRADLAVLQSSAHGGRGKQVATWPPGRVGADDGAHG